MKQKKLRTIVVLLLIAILILPGILTACSTIPEDIPIPEVKKDIYIYDYNNSIDDTVESDLNEMLVQLENQTGIEFTVISVESLLDRTVESYTRYLFNELGIGKKDKGNGILLLFSPSDIKVRLEIGRGLEGTFNDSKSDRILDDYFIPYRNQGEYTKATELTVNAVLNVLAEEYTLDITNIDKSIQIEDSEEKEIPTWIIVLIIIIALAIIFIITDGNIGSSEYFGGSF